MKVAFNFYLWPIDLIWFNKMAMFDVFLFTFLFKFSFVVFQLPMIWASLEHFILICHLIFGISMRRLLSQLLLYISLFILSCSCLLQFLSPLWQRWLCWHLIHFVLTLFSYYSEVLNSGVCNFWWKSSFLCVCTGHHLEKMKEKVPFCL